MIRRLADDLGMREDDIVDALAFAIPAAALVFIVLVGWLIFGGRPA